MRVPYSWLQEYLSEKLPSPKELADMLTLAGLEVDSIDRVGTGENQIVVAEVKEITSHPDASHLWVVKVDAGACGYKQVITGASNLRPGLKVPLALTGAILPGGQAIEAARFRGLLSDGMLCSSEELGLSEKQPHGILILPDDAVLGTNVAEFLDIGDIVLDVEVTPNRADCLSIIGVAREVAAAMNAKLVLPKVGNPGAHQAQTLPPPDITIATPDLCFRYVGALISNISIAPSPGWLRRRLTAAGMRPINSIVDITNYVMLETGQPLHAFDCSTLAQDKIIVRRAQPGETLMTLDGTTHTLTEEMLVIADGEKPQGLAGVMGGLASEVTPDTKMVLLESACFDNINIRRTARSLGFRTEASFRYERNVDPNGALYAVLRVQALLQELNAGELVAISDVYPEPVLPSTIKINLNRVRQLIGAPVTDEFMKEALGKLQLDVVSTDDTSFTVTIPTFRPDLKQEADLVEEVARLYGFDNIPATPLEGKLEIGKEPLEIKMEHMIKRRLLSFGLSEVQTYSFIDHACIDKLKLEPADKKKQQIPLLFPLSQEQSVLRTTLVPSLLEVTATNQRRKARSINIFEINRVYLPQQLPLTELPIMPRQVAIVLSGLAEEQSWQNAPRENDFYRIKGILESIISELGVNGKFVTTTTSFYHPGRQAGLEVASSVVATFGELHPDVAEAFHLSGRIYALELNLTALLPHMHLTTRYQPLPRFPGIERDLALTVPEHVESAKATETIRQVAGPYLVELKLFDVYQGKPIPSGYKSLAYSLVFRAKDHTLTEEEVNPYMDAILDEAVAKIGASIRH
ncbi:MAG: phenylalanine--tRNA ligase subunit beta [bacterium]|jgi:phenylalanyl-tRNA synthetase beta chain